MSTATGPGGGNPSPTAADPACCRTERWCETARFMHRQDGDMKEARVFLRGALDCRGHFPTIYRAWIAMELQHAGGVAAARALFEEWRAWYAAEEAQEGGGGDRQQEEEGQGAFWCHYIAFEVAHGGGAARVRAIAEAAVAARPPACCVTKEPSDLETTDDDGGGRSLRGGQERDRPASCEPPDGGAEGFLAACGLGASGLGLQRWSSRRMLRMAAEQEE